MDRNYFESGWTADASRTARRRWSAGLLAVVLWVPAALAATNEHAEPTTPREFYNLGARLLREGDLVKAEEVLRDALATQSRAVQPPALYDLGHVRFQQGVKELEKGPKPAPARGQSRSALGQADGAIRAADEALAGSDIEKMVAAYLRGRGARKDLRAARRAVQRALETLGGTLRKWERSAGDFRSAHELNPSDADAKFNAEVVERHIAKLTDSIQELQAMANAMGEKQEELGEKMKKLKGSIPEPDMPPGAAGDEEEDEDSPNGPLPDQVEAPGREGQEMQLTPEQAGWLLESFRLESERRLPMGEQRTPPAGDKGETY